MHVEIHDEKTDLFLSSANLSSQSLPTIELSSEAKDDVWTSHVPTEPVGELVASSLSELGGHATFDTMSSIEETTPLAHSLLDDLDTQDLVSGEGGSQNLGQTVATAAASELRRRTVSQVLPSDSRPR